MTPSDSHLDWLRVTFPGRLAYKRTLPLILCKFFADENTFKDLRYFLFKAMSKDELSSSVCRKPNDDASWVRGSKVIGAPNSSKQEVVYAPDTTA